MPTAREFAEGQRRIVGAMATAAQFAEGQRRVAGALGLHLTPGAECAAAVEWAALRARTLGVSSERVSELRARASDGPSLLAAIEAEIKTLAFG